MNIVIKSFFWKLLERFGVSSTQFILQIILARLLSPEHYGVLSIMIIFTTLANVFIQHGFNTALIQNKDVTEDDYSSVLWVSLGIAAVFYAVIFVASPLIGMFYNMPDIVVPMRVIALMLFPGALNSVQLAKVSRKMDFKKVFFSNIGGVVISGIVGIVIAYMGGGLWALVVQHLLHVAVVCIVMQLTVHLKIKFAINWNRVKVLFSYGWKLLMSSLLDTLYQDLCSLVIGKKYDSGTLGYYNRGKQFPQFIINAVNGTIQSVMLPAMSAEQDHRTRVKQMMRASINMSAFVIFPMMAGLAAVAEALVTLLLTEKWLPCVPYMQVYCFTFAFYPVHSCNLQAINAMGRSDLFLKLEIIKKSYGIIALVIAVICFDTPLAIVMTGLITTWIGWFVNSWPNKKLLGYSMKEQMKDLLPSIIMSVSMGACVVLIGMLQIPVFLKLILQIMTGIAIYLVMSAIIKPEPYRMIMSRATEILKRKNK